MMVFENTITVEPHYIVLYDYNMSINLKHIKSLELTNPEEARKLVLQEIVAIQAQLDSLKTKKPKPPGRKALEVKYRTNHLKYVARYYNIRARQYEGGLITWQELEELGTEMKFRCIYCGAETWGFDHMTPIAKGGSNTIDNIASCCSLCNHQKNSRTAEEFVAWRKAEAHLY